MKITTCCTSAMVPVSGGGGCAQRSKTVTTKANTTKKRFNAFKILIKRTVAHEVVTNRQESHGNFLRADLPLRNWHLFAIFSSNALRGRARGKIGGPAPGQCS